MFAQHLIKLVSKNQTVAAFIVHLSLSSHSHPVFYRITSEKFTTVPENQL